MLPRDLPQELVERYHHGVAVLARRGVEPLMAHDLARERVERLWSWRRRAKYDAAPCEGCGTPVLWRREGGRSVPITQEGKVHACR